MVVQIINLLIKIRKNTNINISKNFMSLTVDCFLSDNPGNAGKQFWESYVHSLLAQNTQIRVISNYEAANMLTGADVARLF